MKKSEQEKLLLNYIVKNKICSNKELMSDLLRIYEEESSEGTLIKKNQYRNIISRYIKSITETNGEIFALTFATTMYSSAILTENHGDDLSKILSLFACGVLIFFFGNLLKNQDKNKNPIHNLKFFFKNLSGNLFLTKQSQAKKRMEMYKHTFSLSSIKEIAKYLSEEEMRVFLDNKFSYEDINIFNKDCKVINEIKPCKRIDDVLNKLTIKKDILHNLYNKN